MLTAKEIKALLRLILESSLEEKKDQPKHLKLYKTSDLAKAPLSPAPRSMPNVRAC